MRQVGVTAVCKAARQRVQMGCPVCYGAAWHMGVGAVQIMMTMLSVGSATVSEMKSKIVGEIRFARNQTR